MQGVVESHFWSLTRYRIGRRFLGLDYADNVILFPAYRKKTWGGWAAVTLGATNASYLTNDTSAVNVLEDGYPLHLRASTKLQAFIAEERNVWQKQREEAIARRAAALAAEAATVSSANNDTSTNDRIANNAGEGAKRMTGTHEYDEQQFRDAIIIKCTSPGFAQRHLRLSRLATALYKTLYFYVWGVAISIIVQAYLLFRGWLNPPAREGLKNLESHVLHVPKLLFGLCVSAFAWLAHQVQPLVDPILHVLEKRFPQVNWSAASPKVIATKAHQLAGNEVAAQQSASKEEVKISARRVVQGKAEAERRAWWAQAFLALFCLLCLLCVI
ncbi:hypothetical protein TraAM80_07331 [Trypanosoma rangeli]|uniref:Uncharacterized protein n=1 Tax=Trypanosoma rangeli TaxID=5698 RepID=A0A3R7M7G1_TRYRA|nr:uncharacterized protein TraAM80_07331 [Trypanosoma rangeli]RNF00868.1 hypothetical protein TraAM80_07331 [Trypanosoma rangeli]|eukprot:RNF00868.1 hypothetical protein TraAM80_07331 [Trypanosoma rangeli]